MTGDRPSASSWPRMRDVTQRPNPQYEAQIASGDGVLDETPDNPSRAPMQDVWAAMLPARVATGLVSRLAELLVVPMPRQALPGSPGFDRHATEPRSFDTGYAVFDNRFLLGLRMRAPFRGEHSSAFGTSHPPVTTAEMQLIPTRPRIFEGFVIRWPQGPIHWPNLSGKE